MISPIARRALVAGLFLVLAPACTSPDAVTELEEPAAPGYLPQTDTLRYPGEVHLRNIRQLTFGGNNAEAYWSRNDSLLIFQSDWAAINDQGCDQQFVMHADGTPLEVGADSTARYHLVSTGEGRTTCGYYLPDGRVVYSSTHAAGSACPTAAPYGGSYVWPIHETYDIYVADPERPDEPVLLIGGEGYDAEPTVSADGRFVVFTSTRSGDLDLWRLDIQTGDLLQLTDGLGYDGGAFFSRDGSKLVWRASRPQGQDAERYQLLLEDGYVEPSALNLFVANADGSDARQVTNLPGANWAPFFHPSGEQILFASNHHTLQDGGRLFDLFLVNVDGTDVRQVTHSGTFDAFPMFSSDGRRLVFASNRNAQREPTRDTNIFVADWVERPEAADSLFALVPLE
jgi:dipeptidyl aminopeptidase/acylaminoacyl peptidase